MSKRKKNATLFEVFGGDVSAPRWLKNGQKAEPEQNQPASLKRPPEIDKPIEKTKADDYKPAESLNLTLRLNQQSIIAIVLALFVLCGTSFLLGRFTASPAGDSSGGDVVPGMEENPQGYDFESVQQKAISKLPQPKEVALVIQSDIQNMDDAKEIQKYLLANDILTWVYQEKPEDGSTGKIHIIDTSKYSKWTESEKKGYLETLKALGNSRDWSLRSKYAFDVTTTAAIINRE